MKQLKYITLLAVMLVCSSALTSCGDEEPYWRSPLTYGTWQLIMVNGGYVDTDNGYDLVFYDDGTGEQNYYRNNNYYSSLGFNWDIDTDGFVDELYLNYYTGMGGSTSTYTYELDGMYLYLTDYFSGDTYTFRNY